MNDRSKEYYFQWSSGLPLLPNDYVNWAPGKPDDNSGIENCVEINADILYWDDVICSRKNRYICERPLGKFSHTSPFVGSKSLKNKLKQILLYLFKILLNRAESM